MNTAWQHVGTRRVTPAEHWKAAYGIDLYRMPLNFAIVSWNAYKNAP